MKDASQYPVTFKYGAITAPYSPSRPHLGEDRAMPLNTPIIVSGTKIGYAGTTGYSTGVHLHIQLVENGAVANPRGRGFNLPLPATVYQTGERSDIGKYVRIKDVHGREWSYFHMNKVTAKKGDKLGDDMYKGKLGDKTYNLTAEQWAKKAQLYYGYTKSWRLRYQGVYKRVKSALGKYLGR